MVDKIKVQTLPPTIIKERHDGITHKRNYMGYNVTSFDIGEALKQDNPRNVVLNGQLFVEMECDSIIGLYFCKNDNRAHGVLSEFLQSERCDFSTKIYLLKIMYINESSTGLAKPLIENKIINSLNVIARVRNGFHHNLLHEKALKHSKKDGAKFSLTNKKLEEFTTIEEFIPAFKTEVIELYNALNNIIMEMGVI